MIEAMVQRAEALREGYLARLAETNLSNFSRNRYRHLLTVIEMRLAYLRAESLDLQTPALQVVWSQVTPQPDNQALAAFAV